jgi:alanyl-tRNA synthetase
VEAICQERIDKEVPVDAYVAPLKDAEKISSLRAVYGEKYPDPVRIVAVTPAKIPEILSNPQDAMWNEYSIDFCGGTHLTNTKEAEAIVLLNEEGIAKGIRRILFVTKDDAKKAIAAANKFEIKLDAGSKLEEDKLEAAVKTLMTELDALVISTVKKTSFRWYCLYKEIQRKAIVIVSADDESNRFLVLAMAAKGVDGDCKAWCNAATKGTDANGGGKKDSAQYVFCSRYWSGGCTN